MVITKELTRSLARMLGYKIVEGWLTSRWIIVRMQEPHTGPVFGSEDLEVVYTWLVTTAWLEGKKEE